jgi:hypothetical protein
VARRKLFTDLIAFACIEQFPNAVYMAYPTGQKIIRSLNASPLILREVRFFIASRERSP